MQNSSGLIQMSACSSCKEYLNVPVLWLLCWNTHKEVILKALRPVETSVSIFSKPCCWNIFFCCNAVCWSVLFGPCLHQSTTHDSDQEVLFLEKNWKRPSSELFTNEKVFMSSSPVLHSQVKRKHLKDVWHELLAYPYLQRLPEKTRSKQCVSNS